MYKVITDWSEVWALLIPLFFLIRRKNKSPYLKPVRIYVILAFIINFCAISIQEFKESWGYKLGDFLFSNNFLYNINSVVRLLLFSWFFILLNQRFMHRIKAIIPFAFIVFCIINFVFFQDFFNRYNLSSRLLAIEAALLLFYCLQYNIYLILDDKGTQFLKQPGIWVVIGLTFYVATNFFIFLFYDYLIKHNKVFAVDIWDVHNIAFIFLCVCIAITFNRQYE